MMGLNINIQEAINSIRDCINESLVEWDNDPMNKPEYFADRFIKSSENTSTDLERYYLARGYNIGIDVAKFVTRMMMHEILRSTHENDRNVDVNDIFEANDRVYAFFKDLHDIMFTPETQDDDEIPF